ncbi:P-loop containing nucleoside triphosphate hydrolase protein [Coprinopsis sp. MPI-PUGE-AT-0042]|nr:P-loop containing nucleoside triphosphate hydrolase protein [Coprinopsis sp. MPI-PUGE-AT-0042]
MSANARRERRKLVIVGDGGVGKTTLLLYFATGSFQKMFIPTICENRVADVQVDGREVELGLWDTAGQEDYDRLRPLTYPGAHVILLCFAVDDKEESFMNVEERWIKEIHHFSPGVPIILVGCKTDIRTDRWGVEDLRHKGQYLVSTDEGESLAEKIGAKSYLECSAKRGEGVDELLERATREALQYKIKAKSRAKRRCVVL